jgi:hypothetical protein
VETAEAAEAEALGLFIATAVTAQTEATEPREEMGLGEEIWCFQVQKAMYLKAG